MNMAQSEMVGVGAYGPGNGVCLDVVEKVRRFKGGLVRIHHFEK